MYLLAEGRLSYLVIPKSWPAVIQMRLILFSESYNLLENFILILSWNVLLPNFHLLFLLQNSRKLSLRPFPCDIFPAIWRQLSTLIYHFLFWAGFSSQLYVYCICSNFHFLFQPEFYCSCSLTVQNSLRQSLSLVLIWSLINRLINSQKLQTILRSKDYFYW